MVYAEIINFGRFSDCIGSLGKERGLVPKTVQKIVRLLRAHKRRSLITSTFFERQNESLISDYYFYLLVRRAAPKGQGWVRPAWGPKKGRSARSRARRSAPVPASPSFLLGCLVSDGASAGRDRRSVDPSCIAARCIWTKKGHALARPSPCCRRCWSGCCGLLPFPGVRAAVRLGLFGRGVAKGTPYGNAGKLGFLSDILRNTVTGEDQDATGFKGKNCIVALERCGPSIHFEVRTEGNLRDVAGLRPKRGDVVASFGRSAMN